MTILIHLRFSVPSIHNCTLINRFLSTCNSNQHENMFSQRGLPTSSISCSLQQFDLAWVFFLVNAIQPRCYKQNWINFVKWSKILLCHKDTKRPSIHLLHITILDINFHVNMNMVDINRMCVMFCNPSYSYDWQPIQF